MSNRSSDFGLARYTNSRNFALAATAIVFAAISVSDAVGQTVQLPTVRTFSVRTAVSVPDAGTMRLGGVTRSSRGSISRGVPGLGSVPGPGRFFRNRGIGRQNSVNASGVTAKLIIMSELEQDVLAQARRRQQLAARTDPNGPPAVQHQADFISRHVGRSRRR